jgi:hypothetical protein
MARIRFCAHILPLGAVFLFIGLLYLVPNLRSTVREIDDSVTSRCAEAGAAGKEDCVSALIEVLQSAEIGFGRKNEAIWALGQLADERALPVLQSLQTGIPCPNPCPRDRVICQREVEKAIRWCRGEAWLMRGLRRVFGK